MKIFIKSFLVSLILILVLNLISTILNYTEVININIVKILRYIIPFIASLIGGFIVGINSLNKGWLEGIKSGLIFIIFILIINLIIKETNKAQILLYLLILAGNILGSIIGINKKANA